MSSSGSSGAVGSNGGFARRASGWLGGLTGAVPGFGRLGGVQEDHEDMAGRRRTRLAHTDVSPRGTLVSLQVSRNSR